MLILGLPRGRERCRRRAKGSPSANPGRFWVRTVKIWHVELG